MDVSDLGILAANYGAGTGSVADFTADAKTFGLSPEIKEETPLTLYQDCSSAGLLLVAGMAFAVLSLCGLKTGTDL